MWTKDYERDAYNQVYDGARVFKDANQRKQFALFVVSKLKSELPNGLSSVSKDSLGILYQKIGLSYAKSFNTDNLRMTIPWTPSGEQKLRESFLNSDFIKRTDKKNRNKLCDCLVLEMKKFSPDSAIIPIPDTTYIRIIRSCKAKIGIY